MKLIRVTTIYGEEFLTKLIRFSVKSGLYTDKGFIPLCDIEYIDTIGDIL